MINVAQRWFVVAALAAAAGCASQSGGGNPSSATPARSPHVNSPMTCAALRQLIVKNPPDGFGPLPSLGGPACLDPATASTLEGADYRQFLTSNGFVRGAERTWLDGTKTDVVDVLVYQLRSSAGARAFVDRRWATALHEPGNGTELDVPGIPEAKGSSVTKGEVTAALIVEQIGQFGVVISSSETTAQLATSRAANYARTQYENL